MINHELVSKLDNLFVPGKVLKTLFHLPLVEMIATQVCANRAMHLLDNAEASGISALSGPDSYEIRQKLHALSAKIQKSYFISKNTRLALDRRIIAAGCRAGLRDEAIAGPALGSNLRTAAADYKRDTYSITDKAWNNDNQALIDNLVRDYPSFALHLNENYPLQAQFFEWTILHRFPVALFIRYATASERIPEVALRHIASACPTALAERVDDSGRLKLTLKCRTQDSTATDQVAHRNISVLEPMTAVPFTATHMPAIKDVLNQFPGASSANRDYQFFEDGLRLWHTSDYPDVDLQSPDWWKQLPIFKTLTLQEAQERYHQNLDGTRWVMSPRSVHKSDELVPGDNHTYLEVAVPTEDGSAYHIYPFGRDPKMDPFGMLQTLAFLGKTTLGRIVYVDQGAYYTERRNTGVTIALSPERGQALMEEIRSDINKGLNDEIPFQLFWENCAKWVQDKVNSIMPADSAPNLFEVCSKQVKGPLYKCPKPISCAVLTLFGVHRSKHIAGLKHSLSRTPIYKSLRTYHPANMFRNIRFHGMETFYEVA